MNLMTVQRDADSAEFFDGTANGKLLIRRCPQGHFLPPMQGIFCAPTVRCDVCASPDIVWHEALGDATLVSWVVPYDRSGKPLNIAGIVELTEGPWMNALIDAPVDAPLYIGHPLRVGFVRTEDSECIPAFRPVRGIDREA